MEDVKYNDATPEQQARCDDAIEKWLMWLNEANKRYNDDTWQDITRDDLFGLRGEDRAKWNWEPVIEFDSGDQEFYGVYRMMIFYFDYGDDGGGSHVQALYYPTQRYGRPWDPDLCKLLHQFDTYVDMVWDSDHVKDDGFMFNE